jgi:hypothetical protein
MVALYQVISIVGEIVSASTIVKVFVEAQLKTMSVVFVAPMVRVVHQDFVQMEQ